MRVLISMPSATSQCCALVVWIAMDTPCIRRPSSRRALIEGKADGPRERQAGRVSGDGVFQLEAEKGPSAAP